MMKAANIEAATIEQIVSTLNKDEYDVFVRDLEDSSNKQEFVEEWLTEYKTKDTSTTDDLPGTLEIEGIAISATLQAALDDKGAVDHSRSRVAIMVRSFENGKTVNREVLITIKQAIRSLEYPDSYGDDMKAFVKLFKSTVTGKGLFLTIDSAKAGNTYTLPDGTIGVYQNTGNYVRKLVVDEGGIIARDIAEAKTLAEKELHRNRVVAQFDNAKSKLADDNGTLTDAAAKMFQSMLEHL